MLARLCEALEHPIERRPPGQPQAVQRSQNPSCGPCYRHHMRRASALRRQTSGIGGKPVSNVIGERLREARQSQQLTIQALNERVELQSGFALGQPTLTRIEQGVRSVYDFEVVALSLALKVDAAWLLGLSEC